MKQVIAAVTLVMLLTLPGLAASPEEEARFISAVKHAFVTHDADALVALTCWENAPLKLKNEGRKQYLAAVSAAAPPVKSVVLQEPKRAGKAWDADDDPRFVEIDPAWKESGVAYHSNLPVVKQLKTTFAPTQADAKTTLTIDVTYPVGEKDGNLFLIEPAPIK